MSAILRRTVLLGRRVLRRSVRDFTSDAVFHGLRPLQ